MNELFRLKINYFDRDKFALKIKLCLVTTPPAGPGIINIFPVDQAQYDDIYDGCVWQPLGMWLNPAAKITSFSTFVVFLTL